MNRMSSLLVVIGLLFAPLQAHADDGDVALGTAGRAAIVGTTTTLFLAIGAGSGLGLAFALCPMVSCPRYHPGEPPRDDAPIDPAMLAAGGLLGAAFGGALGAYLSGMAVTLILE